MSSPLSRKRGDTSPRLAASSPLSWYSRYLVQPAMYGAIALALGWLWHMNSMLRHNASLSDLHASSQSEDFAAGRPGRNRGGNKNDNRISLGLDRLSKGGDGEAAKFSVTKTKTKVLKDGKSNDDDDDDISNGDNKKRNVVNRINVIERQRAELERRRKQASFLQMLPRGKDDIDKRVATIVNDNSSCRDKDHFLKLLFQARDANVQTSDYDELCNRLPTHSQIADLYGSEAVVYGMDTCQAYRDLLKPENNNGRAIDPMPRVSGLYHTGTNGLCRALSDNIRRLPRNLKFTPYEIPVRLMICVVYYSKSQ